MNFSVLILTRNEEMNLPDCLDSISWCDDIVVLDSLSDDRTQEIARDRGCRVFERAFDSFAGQRNHALDEIDFRHPWVFHLDADERFTDALRDECNQRITADEHSGYLVPSKMMLMDTWLKHAATYPVYQMRLLKIGEVRFVQVGHGQREGEAERGIGTLREPYLHYAFAKGLDEWFTRHNRYSSEEAEQTLADLANHPIEWGAIFSSDAVLRRRALKRLGHRLPARPLCKFLYQYILRGGFLDGRAGYAYCRLQALYEEMICLKIRERRATQSRKIDS